VVSLIGALGSGKTTLVKGIARSLGVEEEVTSPSFTIMSVYQGRMTLTHVDLYRIDDAAELDYLGFEEALDDLGVCVIEWGEKARDVLPESPVEVHLRMLPNGAREISVQGVAL
jgi:tRNA threonylcarbamoyladenosine biosynthesis protein TsaE